MPMCKSSAYIIMNIFSARCLNLFFIPQHKVQTKGKRGSQSSRKEGLKWNKEEKIT